MDPSIESPIYVIIILAIILFILFIFNTIKKRNDNNNVTSDCKCNLDITETAPINNIPQEQKSDKKILALYYANWCGYSRMFLSDWEKIKQEINSNNFGTITAEYECTQSKQVCENNNIRGFPTMILHKPNGTSIPYPSDKSRDPASVIDFVKSN
jgi:thioredoxin-related protein